MNVLHSNKSQTTTLGEPISRCTTPRRRRRTLNACAKPVATGASGKAWLWRGCPTYAVRTNSGVTSLAVNQSKLVDEYNGQLLRFHPTRTEVQHDVYAHRGAIHRHLLPAQLCCGCTCHRSLGSEQQSLGRQAVTSEKNSAVQRRAVPATLCFGGLATELVARKERSRHD